MALTETAEKIIKMKYSIDGRESWDGIALRVATHVGDAEKIFGRSEEDTVKIINQFYQMISSLYFIPGGRILANAGTGIKNLMNCISGDTEVYTEEFGLIPMARVLPGMHVLTHTGIFKKVLSHWSNGIKRINYYHRGHSNGSSHSIGATSDHNILDNNGNWVKISDSKEITPPKLIKYKEFPRKLEVVNNLSINIENSIPPVVDNSEELAYLIGLFLSEGGISKNRIYFTLNKKETDIASTVILYVKNVFDKEAKIRTYKNRNWINVDINSKQIAEFFEKLSGNGFSNKRIPLWVFDAPEKYRARLLDGILDGDGTIFKNGSIRLVLANPTLVYESNLLARSLGKTTTFKLRAKNKLSKSDTSLMTISNTNYINRIYKLEENYVEVFDMNVEENNSFVAGDTICHNCFVLPLEDSRQSIYNTLRDAAEIFAWGGGVGYNFSHVRETGAPINTTGGKASGPLSFMSLFDQTGEVIQQASRRGAQMGMLSCNHPDIGRFINFKAEPNSRNTRLLEEYDRNLKTYANGKLKNTKYYDVLAKTLLDDQLTHFNISVVADDLFMTSAENDDEYTLIGLGRNNGKTPVSAKELLKKIAHQAWASGDPGMFFLDRTNEDNMVPYLGKLECTNPCGEVPLLPYEACCLGSINLHSFVDQGGKAINLEALEQIVRLAVRFLDNVQEVSYTPLEYVNKQCKSLRRLGLGVMGWADMLAELEIPYDSEDAFKLAEYMSWCISFFAWLESIELAKERGPFKYYDKDQVNLKVVERVLNESSLNPYKFDMNEIREAGLRNVSVTSIAPTGTIAIVSNVNSAIEPFFALAYRRHITEGVGNIAKSTITEINPVLFRKLTKYGFNEEDLEEIKEHILKYGTISGLEKIPAKLRAAFKTSHDLDWRAHLKMQAAWQKYISNAVSKTINMPNSATEEEVFNCYLEAWKSGVKGITIYRDNSRSFQILNIGDSA